MLFIVDFFFHICFMFFGFKMTMPIHETNNRTTFTMKFYMVIFLSFCLDILIISLFVFFMSLFVPFHYFISSFSIILFFYIQVSYLCSWHIFPSCLFQDILYYPPTILPKSCLGFYCSILVSTLSLSHLLF